MRYPEVNRLRRPAATLLAMAALAIGAGATSHERAGPAPQGWHAVVADRAEYDVGTEPLRRPGGEGWIGATIRALRAEAQGSGILQQSVRADAYRGRRVRLSGWLRAVAGEGPGGVSRLWVRVDGAAGALASDYMNARPVAGTREWAPYTLVVDVPREAVGITFGVALTGGGQLWVDDLALEAVGADVAVTGQAGHEIYGGRGGADVGPTRAAERHRARLLAYRLAPDRPVNLDFEQSGIIAVR